MGLVNALCQWVSPHLYWTARHHCLLEQHTLATLTAFSPCDCWLSPCREIPLELRQRSRGGQVNLDMEDHRDEDFSKPKLAFRAFGGEGQKLGRWDWWVLFFYLTWFVNLYSSKKQQLNSVQVKAGKPVLRVMGMNHPNSRSWMSDDIVIFTPNSWSTFSSQCLSCLKIYQHT